ncbi:MAG: hypothetical protein HW419_1539 [Deltaproteobacteria bacterium]|nr:hypothetical protein [Deltaproteobacteria bacterium]
MVKIVRKIIYLSFPNLACFALFARDNPRLTGARSAPYENLRVLGGENVLHSKPGRTLNFNGETVDGNRYGTLKMSRYSLA